MTVPLCPQHQMYSTFLLNTWIRQVNVTMSKIQHLTLMMWRFSFQSLLTLLFSTS